MVSKIFGSGLLVLCFLFSSWKNCPVLRVRTEPLYPIYLASNRINTVDPWKKCFLGQQIVVDYRYPTPSLGEKTLELSIRFKDHCHKIFRFPLSKYRGYWLYRLINEDYFNSGGILSYKINLLEDSNIIATWKHHLYVDLIEIEHTEEEAIVSLSDTIAN